MTFFHGLLTGRSHLAFLVGLGLSLAMVWGVRRVTPPENAPMSATPSAPRPLPESLALPEGTLPLRPTGQPLTAQERRWAEAAWSYFRHNTRPETGLVDSVKGFPSTTLWDTGSYLMAVLSAEQLGLVSREEAKDRLSRALDSLAKLPLCEGTLPNKAYDTRTLAMVNYDNTPSPQGIGWSALDVARIGVPFTAIVWRWPELSEKVRRIATLWKLDTVTSKGVLVGAHRSREGKLAREQEGRFGYEQYAAKSLLLLGLDVAGALDANAHVAYTTVSGQLVPHDARMPEAHGGTHNAVLSEPHVLEGAEFGFDSVTLPVARAVLLAQSGRHAATGKLTAVSEDHLDRAPHFVYASVISGGKPWAVFTPDGAPAEQHRTLSTKAALGWGVLFSGDYPDRLLATIDTVVEPDQGLYGGIYESDGSVNRVLSANTNGIALELLAYRVQGPWLRAARQLSAEVQP